MGDFPGLSVNVPGVAIVGMPHPAMRTVLSPDALEFTAMLARYMTLLWNCAIPRLQAEHVLNCLLRRLHLQSVALHACLLCSEGSRLTSDLRLAYATLLTSWAPGPSVCLTLSVPAPPAASTRTRCTSCWRGGGRCRRASTPARSPTSSPTPVTCAPPAHAADPQRNPDACTSL